MSNQGALATLDPHSAIDEIANGVLLKQIAARYNVAKQAVHAKLCKHPEYKLAVVSQAESIVENALVEVLECEADMVDIARARARYDAAHKWAAARDPANWAAKGATVNIQVNNVIDGGMTDFAGSLIESLRVANTPK